MSSLAFASVLDKIRRVENPLTIIGVFAGITEVAAAIALPCLSAEIQHTFVWFLIIFPFFLVLAFFLTLNFNPPVLYAPGDYRDDKNFLEALSLSSRTVEVRVTESGVNAPKIEQIPPATSVDGLEGITDRQLKAANAFVHEFEPYGKTLFKAGLITSWGFGVHGDGLFLFNATLMPRGDSKDSPSENHIIRARELPDQSVELSIVGKPVKSTNPAELAALVFRSVENTAKMCLKG